MPRYLTIVCAALLAGCVLSPGLGASDPGLEPGLTSRIGCLAIAKMPADHRDALIPIQSDVLERLQMLPVIASDNPSAQIKLIFSQVKDNVASPELMASAARAVTALCLPPSDDPGWSNFRTGVALRSVLADVAGTAVPDVKDPAAIAASLSAEGKDIQTQAIAAAKTGDGAKMTELRKRAASAAARGVVGIWTALLASQKQQPVVTAAAPAETPPDETSEQPGLTPPLETGVVPPSADPPPVAVAATTSAPASNVARAQPVRPQVVRLIGNRVSKKCHRLNCRFLPSAENQIPLGSVTEALRQGYQACRVCKP